MLIAPVYAVGITLLGGVATAATAITATAAATARPAPRSSLRPVSQLGEVEPECAVSGADRGVTTEPGAGAAAAAAATVFMLEGVAYLPPTLTVKTFRQTLMPS